MSSPFSKMSSGPRMSGEEFQDIERQLEENVAELRATRNWRLRRDILDTIQRLVREANRLISEDVYWKAR